MASMSVTKSALKPHQYSFITIIIIIIIITVPYRSPLTQSREVRHMAYFIRIGWTNSFGSSAHSIIILQLITHNPFI
jgi:hypothetical protein